MHSVCGEIASVLLTVAMTRGLDQIGKVFRLIGGSAVKNKRQPGKYAFVVVVMVWR